MPQPKPASLSAQIRDGLPGQPITPAWIPGNTLPVYGVAGIPFAGIDNTLAFFAAYQYAIIEALTPVLPPDLDAAKKLLENLLRFVEEEDLTDDEWIDRIAIYVGKKFKIYDEAIVSKLRQSLEKTLKLIFVEESKKQNKATILERIETKIKFQPKDSKFDIYKSLIEDYPKKLDAIENYVDASIDYFEKYSNEAKAFIRVKEFQDFIRELSVIITNGKLIVFNIVDVAFRFLRLLMLGAMAGLTFNRYDVENDKKKMPELRLLDFIPSILL